MRKLSEAEAVARLQRSKAAFQTHVKLNFEHAARDCRACPTPGVCCTDAHFVNVHITRLEAVAIRETLARTPRLTEEERRAVYVARARRSSATASRARGATRSRRPTRARSSSRARAASSTAARSPRRASSTPVTTTGRTCPRSTCSGARSGASNSSTRKSTARRGRGCRRPSGSRSLTPTRTAPNSRASHARGARAARTTAPHAPRLKPELCPSCARKAASAVRYWLLAVSCRING